MSGLIVGLVLHTRNTQEFDQGSKFVAVVYADHARDDGTNAYPAVETVAGIIGCSARTVQRHVRALEKMGMLIAYGKGPRGQTKYRFPLETGADGYVRLTPAGRGDNRPPRQIVTPGGDRDSGDRDSGDTGVTQLINPSFKPKEEEEETRAQAFSDELQHALVEAGVFKPCWADVAARLAGGWTERDIFALLAWMREAGGRPGRFVARLREGTRAPGRYYPLLPADDDAPADAEADEDTAPQQPEWWPALVRNSLPDANRSLREKISRAVVRWDGPDLLIAVPGADPAVLAERFGKTLENALSGPLSKPPYLRFVAVEGET